MLLVTGAAGYVASHVLRTYLSENSTEEIVALDDLSEGHKQAIPQSPRVHFEEGNLGDAAALNDLFTRYKPTGVMHFGASAYVGVSENEPFKYYQNNVVNFVNLTQVMDAHNVRRIVFSSSCAVYGDPQTVPVDENHPLKPVSVYGQTKYMNEIMLQSLARTRGLSSVSLRYFNAAGADESGEIGERHDPETHLIPLVLKVAKARRGHIDVYGTDYPTRDGSCIRDYIHVTDLARAHIAALKLLEAAGDETICQFINLGTANGASVLEVIDVCRKVTGFDIPANLQPRRPGDAAVIYANNDKAARLLNWTPQYSLERIVETAWKWEQHGKF